MKNEEPIFKRVHLNSYPDSVVMQAKFKLNNDENPDSDRFLIINVFLGQISQAGFYGSFHVQLFIQTKNSNKMILSEEVNDMEAINDLLYPFTQIKTRKFIQIN